MSECPDVNSPRHIWAEWAKKVETKMKALQTTLCARERNKQRKAMKTNIQERERQSTIQKALKKFLNYALKRNQREPRPLSLIIEKENKEGKKEVKIIDKKEDIMEAEMEHCEIHMGKNRKAWYLNSDGDMMDEFKNTPKGKKWRAALAEGKLNKEETNKIPLQLRKVFEHAKAVKKSNGETISKRDYGNIFTSQVSIESFNKYLKKKKKNTAPGVSEIRIDHIVALNVDHKQMICNLLSMVYLTGMGYDQWKHEIVNWIPKEPGNPDMNKRRPLMFYEVMRKMCMGVKKQQVMNVWLKHKTIDKDNYAFMPGFDTSDPLMIKKMIMEDAKYYNKTLALIDVDFSKAYDSTETFAKDISLRRMGFPEEGLALWQMYDETREMRIETAYGPTGTIKPECGAWGQGAEESPMGWLCLMSWLSAYVNTETTKPYKYTINKEKSIDIIKTIYADDGNYMSRTHKSAKQQAHAISNFSTSTGIIVKPQKSYIYANYVIPDNDVIEITTYKGDGKFGLGEPNVYALKQIKATDFWRHLGNVQNAEGRTTIQDVKMHDGSTFENILTKTKNNINTLKKKAISITAANIAVQTVIIPQIMYPAIYNNMSANEIEQLQIKIRQIYRTKMKGRARNLPNNIVHGHKNLEEWAWTNWWIQSTRQDSKW